MKPCLKQTLPLFLRTSSVMAYALCEQSLPPGTSPLQMLDGDQGVFQLGLPAV